MPVPFPVGFISGRELLTKVTVELQKTYLGPASGGFEDETDADGGTNLQTGTGFPTTYSAGYALVTYDLSADGILWSDKYLYRLGFANVYRFKNMKLYKNGVLAEDQGASIITLAGSVSVITGHMGANVNPSSRGISETSTGSGEAYPK